MSNRSLADRSILIVEDELLIAMEFEREVQNAGGTVVGPAPSVEHALRLLAGAHQIDAALLDVTLRGDKSFPVAEQLGEREVPFVFLTGQVASIPSQFDHIARIEKPAAAHEVLAALEVCLT